MTAMNILKSVVGMLVMTLSTSSWSQIQGASLYFLSGTPSNDDVNGYPANLYRVSGGKLEKVREVVSASSGIESVQQSDDAIFLAYPHIIPSTISVIHTNQPNSKDDFVFNPTRKTVIDNRQAIAPTQSGVEELFFLVQGPTDAPGSCIAVTGEGKPGQRVIQNAANQYSNILFKGTPGGPKQDQGLVIHVLGKEVQIETCGTAITIATLPTNLALSLTNKYGGVVAADDRFLIIEFQIPNDEFESRSIFSKSVYPMYVLDKRKEQWSKSFYEGTCSSSRIYGNWLASTVSFFSEPGKVSPGEQNERSVGTPTQPNVREMYSTYAGEHCYFPGVLTIQDLSRNRKITIHTDQQDSEVLTVDDSKVVYRVNDEIYSASLTEEGVLHPSLLVKDENVPEIHWAFWSKQ